jgi:poly(A)-specific ribonuclease
LQDVVFGLQVHYAVMTYNIPFFSSSLFDTGRERYGKLRQSIEHFLVMQVGITAFRFIDDKNKYKASKYTFYVFPRSFASINNIFMCQSSSLEFLCQNNFDFNKVRRVIFSEKTIMLRLY